MFLHAETLTQLQLQTKSGQPLSELPLRLPIPPQLLASLTGHLHQQSPRRRTTVESGWPLICLWIWAGEVGTMLASKQDRVGGGGGGGAALREGWDGIFPSPQSAWAWSLADLLDQLLIRQAVKAVDGQVRDEVLAGLPGDLLAASQVNQGDVGDAPQVEQGLVCQLIAT